MLKNFNKNYQNNRNISIFTSISHHSVFTRPPFLFFQHSQQCDTLLPIVPCTHKLKAGLPIMYLFFSVIVGVRQLTLFGTSCPIVTLPSKLLFCDISILNFLNKFKFNTHVTMNRPFFCVNQDKNIDNEVYHVCIKFPSLLIPLTMVCPFVIYMSVRLCACLFLYLKVVHHLNPHLSHVKKYLQLSVQVYIPQVFLFLAFQFSLSPLQITKCL